MFPASAFLPVILSALVCLGGCRHSFGNRKVTSVLLQPESPATTKASAFLSEVAIDGQDLQEMSEALLKQQWPAAIEQATTYLRKTPDHSGAFLVLATAHAAQQQYDLAAYFARQVQELSPLKHAAAANILGLARLARAQLMQDYRAAQAYFTQAYAQSGQEVAAGLNLGYLQLELGAVVAAAQTFAGVRERCDDCLAALNGHAIALNRLGRYGEAKSLLEDVLAEEPDDATALYQLALYYRNAEADLQEAAIYLEKLLATDTGDRPELREKARLLLDEEQL